MSKDASEVSRNRFEFEDEGETAYLEFEVDGHGWLTLWHTEVPTKLRGRGIAGVLAQTAFEYARDNNLKVDVICPVAQDFLEKHPEFKGLIGK
jgi:predicted GNAT family acetyltransferase